MQNLHEVISGINGQKAVGEIVERIEGAGLAFRDEGESMTDAGIPEWEFAGLQAFCKESFLREEIGIEVAANQSPTRPETAPEDPRQRDGHNQNDAGKQGCAERFLFPQRGRVRLSSGGNDSSDWTLC